LGADPLLGEELERRLVPLDRPRPAAEAASLEHEGELALEERANLLALERPEDDDAIDPVQELGTEGSSEHALDDDGPEARTAVRPEAERPAALHRRPQVRREDDDALPEVRRAPLA